MRFRKLRIAWSVFWGLACILPIVLWSTSYRGPGTGYLPVPGVCCRSAEGILLVARFGNTPESPRRTTGLMSFNDLWMDKPIDIAPNHKWGGLYFAFTNSSFFWIR